MASRQKYTEETRPCEYDASFFELLREFHKQAVITIINTLEYNADSLPIEEGWVQEVGCVIKGVAPLFLVVRYLHQEEEKPLFLEIEEIECDEYLDFILEDKILIDLDT